MTNERNCTQCGAAIPATRHIKSVYCSDACKHQSRYDREKAADKNRARHAAARREEYRTANVVPVQPVRVPRVACRRAATLSETPDVPAVRADRDSMLTGGASAVSYAQAVRMVGVGI